jgi:N-methylhydantoinase B
MTAILSTVAHKLPINGGCFRPVKIIAPEGSMVNPLPPAATTQATSSCFNQILNCTWGALAQFSPELAIADWSRCGGVIVVGVDPRTGEAYSGIEFHSAGGAGANWGTDGWSFSGYGNALIGGTAEEHEIYEILYPHMLLYHRLSNDSGGPGRWRGGLGVEYAWVSEAPGQGLLTPHGDGFFTGVEGARGGRGPTGVAERGDQYLIKAGGIKVDARKRCLYYYEKGDTYYYRSNGGGGVGSPLERDPEAVELDVMNELVSVQSARENYGVIFREEKWPYPVDYEATEKLRKNQT